MNRSAFPRIARQLNYKRTLTSPITARVDVPGLPYEAFDQSGAKVQPWSLLRLFESVRASTFWDYPNNPPSSESLADFHVVLRDHFFFIVSARLSVDRYLYSDDAPKFPVFVTATLDYVGKSSKRLSYSLYHPDVKSEYAKCTVTDVLVSSIDRKPVAYPDWWTKKFAHMCKNETSPNIEFPSTQVSESLCSSYQVNLTDIDTYKHTNWSSYVKFCFESIYKHVSDKNYSNINSGHLDNGMKSIDMIYKSESNLYDNLKVLTREDKHSPNGVYGDIVKEDGTVCFQLMMDFFSSEEGAKVQPWSLLRFFESVRASIFWDYPNTAPSSGSLADFHVVLRDHLIFVVSARLTIDRYLYKEDAPKFPLFVNTTVDYVGKSSQRLLHSLYHPDVKSEYAKCIVTDVLVSSIDRKPVAYPDWWAKKFAHLCKNETSPNIEFPSTQVSESLCSSYQVNLTDIDTYKHTNWSSYVKFCFESIYKHVSDKKYNNISGDHMENGVKSIDMIFKSESNLYDKLKIFTREDRHNPNAVYGDIVKEDGTVCFQIMVDFFSSEEGSKL